MRGYLIGILWLCVASLTAQSDKLDALSELYESQSYSPYSYSGFLDKSLPIHLVFGVQGSDVMGYLYYGGNADRYTIEGTVSDEGDLQLYEFDEHSRVTAQIEGNIKGGTDLFKWYNLDRTREMSLLLKPYTGKSPKMTQYTTSSERPVIVRGDLQQISSFISADTDIRWIDFLCEGSNCYENRPNVKLNNPLEFVYSDMSGMEELMFYPDVHYQKDRTANVGHHSEHHFDHFSSYSYPSIGDQVFDEWVEQIYSKKDKKNEEEDDYPAISDRLSSRSNGDFFITLWSDDLISGYLYQQSSETNKVVTLPFIFDISKSRFYRIGDLFDKGFDYSFFIEKYIASAQQKALRQEPRMVKNLLKKSQHRHFVLTPEGLLCFTDFHVIYGRRYVLIPYSEIRSALGNKSVERYVKNQKK